MRLKPLVTVLDDDPSFRKALEVVLGRFGLDIRATADPEWFVELARNVKPDLLLVDLQLDSPGVTGFDVIKRLRAQDPQAVIVVISGGKDRETLMHALEIGANDFILKPLDRVLLASKLARYVDTDKIREQRAQAVDGMDGSAPVRLAFEAEITEVDELGVGLASRHLIPKGTSLRIKSPILQEASGGKGDEALLTIVSTSFDPISSSYTAYGEFSEATIEFLDAVRGWLLR